MPAAVIATDGDTLIGATPAAAAWVVSAASLVRSLGPFVLPPYVTADPDGLFLIVVPDLAVIANAEPITYFVVLPDGRFLRAVPDDPFLTALL